MSHAELRRIVEKAQKPLTDKELNRVERKLLAVRSTRWDTWRKKSTARPMKIWFSQPEYEALRKAFLQSNEWSMHRFLKITLGVHRPAEARKAKKTKLSIVK